MAWARAQSYSIGRRCSICSTDMNEAVRAVCTEWAAGRTAVNALSWPKIAEWLRTTYGTLTTWTTVRDHVRLHEPKLWAKIERRVRRGSA